MAIILDPELAGAYRNRGAAYLGLGQSELAIENFDEALRLDPRSAETLNNRGRAHLNLGQVQLALDDFDEAIRLDPQSADAYNNRGFAYLNAGQVEQAIEDYDEAVRIDPEVAGAYYNRGLAARDALHHTPPTIPTSLPPSGAAGGDLSGTYPDPTIAANAVALGTDTTGNYVATVAGNTQIGVSGSGSEGAVVSLSIGANSLDAGHIAANAVGASELASTAIAPGGTFGSATQVATFTVDADGRLTAASNVTISGVSATDNTKVLKAGDTMTGQLIFSGVATDITTGTDEHLVLSPNGTGNVGIGTTSPSEKLQVNDGSIFVNGSEQGLIVDSGGSKRVGFMKYPGREAGIWRVSLQDFEIGRVTVPALPGSPDYAATNPKAFIADFYIANNGFVGIGADNTSPSATLDVKGSTKLSAVTVGGSTLHVTAVGAPVNPARVGIGTTSPSAKLDVVGDTELNGNLTTTGNLTTGGDLTVDTSTLFVDSTNNRVGIGTTSPTESMQMDGGFFYINGESGGFVIDAGGFKRIGFMKYFGREAGVWRVPGQDYEIGRVTIPDDPLTTTVDESIILPGIPTGFATDLYISGSGNVGIGVGNGAGAGSDQPARKLHVRDVMRLEPRSSAPSSASQGDIYVDSTGSGALCFYDGSAWQAAAGSGTCS